MRLAGKPRSFRALLSGWRLVTKLLDAGLHLLGTKGAIHISLDERGHPHFLGTGEWVAPSNPGVWVAPSNPFVPECGWPHPIPSYRSVGGPIQSHAIPNLPLLS